MEYPIFRALSMCLLVALVACSETPSEEEPSVTVSPAGAGIHDNRIQILNLGTFHMGFTSDSESTEFNEKDLENQRRVHEIARKLVEFDPTVILIEGLPEEDEQLRNEYLQYVNDPDMVIQSPSEVELLAFELGRLCGTERIYGIDHRMSYNYLIAREVDNAIDSATVYDYYSNPFRNTPDLNVDEDTLNLLDHLRMINDDRYLDFMMAINADILTHVGTEDGFEGADEAVRFYHRNLRIYSNLNRINLSEDDRVFILMGAAHTAFLRDFIRRSPKYRAVDPFIYLK